MARNNPGSRFQMWVDAVGGFLVCMADEVTLGQAVLGTPVDVPIVGDLSRRHATIRRESGSYLIIPSQAVRVAGRHVDEATALSDGDEIELGSTFVMRFRQPHPLSSTGRLEVLSNHRCQPPADAVVLMAEACILGPNPSNHVVCRDMTSDLVLFRRDDTLHCRSEDAIEIDGKIRGRTARIHRDSRICGRDFCLSLEPLE